MSAILENLGLLVHTRKDDVDAWFAHTFRNAPPFFYNSVDIRHSGFKAAPVDTNLFPGGFNNLSREGQKRAVNATKAYFEHYFPKAETILLLAEDHTRNLFYLENVAVIQSLLECAGKRVIVTSVAVSDAGTPLELESKSGIKLHYTPCVRKDERVETKAGVVPDLVLVNNDMTEGAPELIQHIEQTVMPPLGFGWYKRRKTSHFDTYDQLLRDFCREFSLDPWLLSTMFHRCGTVNFKERKGVECVALGVERTLFRIRQKYDEYGIKQEPYVFIKSDRGTYGMGIMTARSGDEVLEMGKKIRNQMNAIKGGGVNTSVIIQEGVPTIDTVDENPAEPMMYLVGGQVVGCMYRLNTRKDSYGNLNASGMQFTSMKETGAEPCRALGFIARLASSAASWECYVESYVI